MSTDLMDCCGVRGLRAIAQIVVFSALLFASALSSAEERTPRMGNVEFAQFLLIWTGDYNGLVDGIVGPQTSAAIQRYFTRKYGRLPQELTKDQITALVDDAANAIADSGFTLYRDQELDVTFGVPRSIVELAPNPDPLHRSFQSPDGTVRIEVVHLTDRYESLQQLLTKLSDMEGRTVLYSKVRPTWFVLSGRDTTTEFYVRYHGDGREIRGFSISYTPDHARVLAPAIVAMSNVFRPSATASDPLISFVEELQGDRSDQDVVADSPEIDQSEEPRSTSSGSGFVVDDNGDILTNAHVVANCGSIFVGATDRARLVAVDPRNDLALVQTAPARTIPPLIFRSDSIRLGEEVVAAGYPLHGILADSINITPGVVSSLSGLQNDSRYLQTTAAVQPGNSGGPLVDRSGKVIGIVTYKLNAVVALEQDRFIPENVNFAIRHETIRPFLEANRIGFKAAPRDPDPKSVEGIADLIGPSVVAIECRGSGG